MELEFTFCYLVVGLQLGRPWGKARYSFLNILSNAT
jgi:hypothetical protein